VSEDQRVALARRVQAEVPSDSDLASGRLAAEFGLAADPSAGGEDQ
jgi:hypothetical protein